MTAHTPACGYCCGVPEELEVEIDGLRAELARVGGAFDVQADEIIRLRDELAGFKAELTHIEAVNDDLEEIIARVRELCDNTPDLVGFHVTLPGSVSVTDVLAAIEGNQP